MLSLGIFEPSFSLLLNRPTAQPEIHHSVDPQITPGQVDMLPGSPTNLYTLSAVQVLSLFRDNAITVEDYAKSLLARVESRDDTVKAWAYLG